jgi:hypothetical protein
VSHFKSSKTRVLVGGKGIRAVHRGVDVWETKIDWLFGTVNCHVLYIIIVTNRSTNTMILNHLMVADWVKLTSASLFISSSES